MTTSPAAAAAALAVGAAILIASPRPSRARLDNAWNVPARRPTAALPAPPGSGESVRGRRASASVLGLAVVLVVGGVTGVIVGGVAAAVTHRVLGRLEPRSVMQRRRRSAADLPTCALLLAGALEAGASPLDALDIVAEAVPGPIASHLTTAAAELRLGADPARVWADLDPRSGLAPLARTINRAITSGAPLADALHRLAIDLRDRRRHEIDNRARAVGVRAAAPLGLCFLPAFLLIGVIPVVIGIAQQILTGLL